MLIVLYCARFKMGNKILKKEREGERGSSRQGGSKGMSEGPGGGELRPVGSGWNVLLGGGKSNWTECSAQSLQPCPTLCDHRPPGSSVHGILRARKLEWVAMPSPRGSSQLRDQTQVSYIVGRLFTV